jgi:hypothetical protein
VQQQAEKIKAIFKSFAPSVATAMPPMIGRRSTNARPAMEVEYVHTVTTTTEEVPAIVTEDENEGPTNVDYTHPPDNKSKDTAINMQDKDNEKTSKKRKISAVTDNGGGGGNETMTGTDMPDNPVKSPHPTTVESSLERIASKLDGDATPQQHGGSTTPKKKTRFRGLNPTTPPKSTKEA